MEIDVTLIGQMITFILFVIFTMTLIWPPIMRALAARQQKIAEGLAATERAEQELENARHKAKNIIQEAKAQASGIVDQANHRAHRIVEEAQVEARTAADKIRAAAHEDIEDQYRVAQAELKAQTADLAIRCSEKLLQKNMDAAANQVLIDQLIAEVRA